jgi:hypothetical protein
VTRPVVAMPSERTLAPRPYCFVAVLAKLH